MKTGEILKQILEEKGLTYPLTFEKLKDKGLNRKEFVKEVLERIKSAEDQEVAKELTEIGDKLMVIEKNEE